MAKTEKDSDDMDPRRLKRLAVFREHQRDLAAADMILASQEVTNAQQAEQSARVVLEETESVFRKTTNESISALEMELLVASADVAAKTLQMRQKEHEQAQQAKIRKRDNLLKSQVKLKQIEHLEIAAATEQSKIATQKEQLEQDDLAFWKGMDK